MRGKIGLEDLAIDCIIGCLAAERAKSQTVLIDFRLELALGADDIEKTVNYEELAIEIETLAINGKFYLIETLALSIAEFVLSKYANVFHVWVRVKKPKAIKQAAFAVAECEKRR